MTDPLSPTRPVRANVQNTGNSARTHTRTQDFSLIESEIGFTLEQLGRLFSEYRLTLIVRDPGKPGAALLFGNDEPMKKILYAYFGKVSDT